MAVTSFAFRRRAEVASVVALCALVANVSTPPAALASAPQSAASAAEVCPKTLALESTNGSDYVAVFVAPSQITATFHVRLYSETDSYEGTTPAETLSMPFVSEIGARTLRSVAIDLRKPPESETVAAAVTATVGEAGRVCPEEDIFIPSVKSLTDPHRSVSKQQADLENAFGSEIGMGESAVELTAAPPTPQFACKKPFQRAGVSKVAMASYSLGASEANASGVVGVLVDLNESGSVVRAALGSSSGTRDLDLSALDAAHNSAYHTEIFACKPRPAHYLFVQTFNNGDPQDPRNDFVRIAPVAF